MTNRAVLDKAPWDNISKRSVRQQRLIVRNDWQRIQDIPNPDETVQLEAITASRHAWTARGQRIPVLLLDTLDLSSPRILEALIRTAPQCFQALREKGLPLTLRHKVLAEALLNQQGLTFFSDSARVSGYPPEIVPDAIRKAALLVHAIGIETADKQYTDTLESAYLGLTTGEGLKDLNHLGEPAQVQAVLREPTAIQFITRPSEAVQLTAVPLKSKPTYVQVLAARRLIGLIDVPCEKLQMYALTQLRISDANKAGFVARLTGDVKQAYALATTALGIDPDSPEFVEILTQIHAGLQDSHDQHEPAPR